MKDAVLTIRMPSHLRRRVEELARREGRSLSQQAGWLIELGIGGAGPKSGGSGRRVLSGLFQGGRVPTLEDFREARRAMSRSLASEDAPRADARR